MPSTGPTLTRRAMLPATTIGVALIAGTGSPKAQSASGDEARAIAKEAYLYGFPMVECYKTLHTQAVDRQSPNFKAPFNQISNTANVFTPKDTAFVTPNSDTPYSFIWMDLRAEPMVLTLPDIDPRRYLSVQLIDLYTQNFAYLGRRTTGAKAGGFLVAGPKWQGDKPAGISAVVRCESEIAYALYRTQLFGSDDLDNVKRIQSTYRIQPLSAFLNQPAPAAAPVLDWPKPDPTTMTQTPAIFRYMNFLMALAPTDPSETALKARFARIGIGAGLAFDEQALSAETRQALEGGIADGVKEYETFKATQLDTAKVSSGEMFGTRAFLKNNYLYRYAGAKLGIFGNSREEALYLGYFVDRNGAPANAAQHRYVLRFEKDRLPPANAFWSLTLYDGKTQLLVDNPLNRYLVNSPMLPQLKTAADGSLTLTIQQQSPGAAEESNWLPAPNGPFYLVLRVYEPKPDLISGAWIRPPLQPVD